MKIKNNLLDIKIIIYKKKHIILLKEIKMV